MAALFLGDLDGLDVGTGSAPPPAPLDNGKAGQSAIFFSNPRGGIRSVHQAAHVFTSKAEWRLEAILLDSVERRKVTRSVGAIKHIPNLRRHAAKSHPRWEDGFLRSVDWVGLDLGFKVPDDGKEALIETAIGGDGFLDGDVGDVQPLEHRDPAPLLVVDISMACRP